MPLHNASNDQPHKKVLFSSPARITFLIYPQVVDVIILSVGVIVSTFATNAETRSYVIETGEYMDQVTKSKTLLFGLHATNFTHRQRTQFDWISVSNTNGVGSFIHFIAQF